MQKEERLNVFGRAILALIGFFALLAVVMFLPAGIGWWKGWLFLAVFLFQMWKRPQSITVSNCLPSCSIPGHSRRGNGRRFLVRRLWPWPAR